MKNVISILAILLFFTSCGNDPEQASVEVRFRLLYDGDPLVMFDELSYPDSKSIFFTRISFFIEDMMLNGEESLLITERDYIALTDSHLSATDAEKGALVYNGNIDHGDYNVSFHIGVSQPHNDMVPADFPSSDVLSDAAEYWPGWESYVFAKVEGRVDLDGDLEEETGVAMHLGGNDAFRSVTTGNYTIDDNNTEIVIDINLEKLFGSGASLHDIATIPQIHNPEQNPIVNKLADNLVTCF